MPDEIEHGNENDQPVPHGSDPVDNDVAGAGSAPPPEDSPQPDVADSEGGQAGDEPEPAGNVPQVEDDSADAPAAPAETPAVEDDGLRAKAKRRPDKRAPESAAPQPDDEKKDVQPKKSAPKSDLRASLESPSRSFDQVPKNISATREALGQPEGADVRKDHATLGQLLNTIGSRGVDQGQFFEQIQHATFNIYGAPPPRLTKTDQTPADDHAVWNVEDFSVEYARGLCGFLLSTTGIRSLLDRLHSEQPALYLVSSQDAAYLTMVVSNLGLALYDGGLPLKVLHGINYKQVMRLSEDAKDDQYLNNAWYVVESCSAGFLQRFSYRDLEQLSDILRARKIGLLLTVCAGDDQIPAAWRSYLTVLESMAPRAQFDRFIECAPGLTPEEHDDVNRFRDDDETFSAYIDMDLTYDEVRDLAALVISYVRNEVDYSVFPQILANRLQTVLHRWLDQYDESLDHRVEMLALAALNGATHNDVRRASESLKARFEDLPEIDIPVKKKSRAYQIAQEKRAQKIREHPLMQTQNDWLTIMLARQDTAEMRVGNGQVRDMQIVRFKFDGFYAHVLEYYWSQFVQARNELIEWLHELLNLNTWPNYINHLAARAVGILAISDYFTIEQSFILPMADAYQDDDRWGPMMQLLSELQRVTQDETDPDLHFLDFLTDVQHRLIQPFRAEMLHTAGKISSILWWAYLTSLDRTRAHIEDNLHQWAQNRDNNPSYRLIATTCYGRIGAYCAETALKDLEHIARVGYIKEPPEVDWVLVSRYFKHELDSDRERRWTSTWQPHYSRRGGSSQTAGERRQNQLYERVQEQFLLIGQHIERQAKQMPVFEVMRDSLAGMLHETVLMLNQPLGYSVGPEKNSERGYNPYQDTHSVAFDASDLHQTAMQTQSAILTTLDRWIRSYKRDPILARMGAEALYQMASERVKDTLASHEAQRYNNWGVLMYVTWYNDDALVQLCDTLRYMLSQPADLREIEETGATDRSRARKVRVPNDLDMIAGELLDMMVKQVDIKRDKTIDAILRRRSYRYCQIVMWHVAFGENATRIDRDRLVARCRTAAYARTSDNKPVPHQVVWKLLADYLEG